VRPDLGPGAPRLGIKGFGDDHRDDDAGRDRLPAGVRSS
jgi:hypothetical protein